VHDRLLRPADRVVGALDQVVAALGEHLDRHVVGDVAALDEFAAEVEVGLAGAREADLDLLVAHLDQQLEHPQLAVGVHRVDERLVAVAQVDRAPARRLGHDACRARCGPAARPDLLLEGEVLRERHRSRMLGVDHRWGFAFVSSTSGSADGHDNLRDEGRPIQAPPRQRRRRSPRMMRISMPCPRPCDQSCMSSE
jgi:hypothetical protein